MYHLIFQRIKKDMKPAGGRFAKRPFILVLFALLLTGLPVTAQKAVSLGENARITLLTCSPGDDLYSIFGHSAVRVHDPDQNLDAVFNYGTFDFSDPNFYLNFVRGKLNYKLSLASYTNFEYQYFYEERWIWEQELNLGPDEKQYLFDSLVINYLPDNRYYLYDFFFDNCATRIRDIFAEAIESQVAFDYSGLEHGKSFRELLMPYLDRKPWARLGINLALGLPADKTAAPWDYMFLPDHMMTVFGSTGLWTEDEIINFVSPAVIILEGEPLSRAGVHNLPVAAFILILIAAIFLSWKNLQSGSFSWWFDRLLFGLAGSLGLLISFLWFGTDHQVTVWNLNILWAHPFNLVIIFFFYPGRYPGLLKYFFSINLSFLVLLILSWPFLPQPLPLEVMPYILAMIVRSAVILKKLESLPVTWNLRSW
jgi:hypothetical protein